MSKYFIDLSLDCVHVSAHYCCTLVYLTVCGVIKKVKKREKKKLWKKIFFLHILHILYCAIFSKKNINCINNLFNYDFADSLACRYRGMSYLPVPQQLWSHDLQAPCNFTLHSVTRTGVFLYIFKGNIKLKATDFY